MSWLLQNSSGPPSRGMHTWEKKFHSRWAIPVSTQEHVNSLAWTIGTRSDLIASQQPSSQSGLPSESHRCLRLCCYLFVELPLRRIDTRIGEYNPDSVARHRYIFHSPSAKDCPRSLPLQFLPPTKHLCRNTRRDFLYQMLGRTRKTGWRIQRLLYRRRRSHFQNYSRKLTNIH